MLFIQFLIIYINIRFNLESNLEQPVLNTKQNKTKITDTETENNCFHGKSK